MKLAIVLDDERALEKEVMHLTMLFHLHCAALYSGFEKDCPTKACKRTPQCRNAVYGCLIEALGVSA